MANRHCHQCGTPYLLSGAPGRSETCERCRGDLKVCLNCVHFDARVAHQCRERRAEPVAEKGAANFCEYFEFIVRDWQPGAANAREAAARDRLKNLFGGD
jgi:hypothetical protein